MNLLPYTTVTLHTPQPLPSVIARLENYIEPAKPMRWGFSRNHKPYEGRLSDTGFEIHRIIHYRNSLLPVIRGRFQPLADGTQIQITMGLHPLVIGFLVFWYLTWYSALLPMWLTGGLPTEVALLLLGMPSVMLAIFWGAFWYEANRSRRDLEAMVMGELQPPPENRQTFQLVQLVWVLIGVAFAVWQLTPGGFFQPSQLETQNAPLVTSCTEQPPRSPDCTLSQIHTLTGHTTVSTLSISADGNTLVSGGSDKAIKVWDLKTGQLTKTLQSNSGKVVDLAIAPDGKAIVSAGGDRMVRVWSLTTNQRPLLLKGHASDVRLVSITSNSRTVVSGGLDGIKTWDLATGKVKTTFPQLRSDFTLGPITVTQTSQQVVPLAISSDGTTAILDHYSKGVTVWDLATNQERAVLKEKGDAFAGYVMSAVISPDGKTAALQYSNSFKKFETRLKVWDLTTGTVIARGSTGFSRSTFINLPLAVSHDRIIGSTNGQLKIWNLYSAQLATVLDAPSMSHLVVSADGKLLAGVTGDAYNQSTTIKVFRRP